MLILFTYTNATSSETQEERYVIGFPLQ